MRSSQRRKNREKKEKRKRGKTRCHSDVKMVLGLSMSSTVPFKLGDLSKFQALMPRQRFSMICKAFWFRHVGLRNYSETTFNTSKSPSQLARCELCCETIVSTKWLNRFANHHRFGHFFIDSRNQSGHFQFRHRRIETTKEREKTIFIFRDGRSH